MAASAKTLLVGAAIALAVALFTLQSAHAGGYSRLPFVPFNSYAADTYVEEMEYYGRQRTSRYGSDVDDAVSTARSVARKYLDTDLGNVFEDLDD